MTSDVARLQALLDQKAEIRQRFVGVTPRFDPHGYRRLTAEVNAWDQKFARFPTTTLEGAIFKLREALHGCHYFNHQQCQTIMQGVLACLLEVCERGDVEMRHAAAPESSDPRETIRLCNKRLQGMADRRLKMMLTVMRLSTETKVPELQSRAIGQLQRVWNMTDHGSDAEFGEIFATMAGALAAIKSTEKAEKAAAKPRRSRRPAAKRRVKAAADNVVSVQFGGAS